MYDIEEERYNIYWKKAKEFYQIMKFAEDKELWIGAGLLGIHCAISLCDALTTFYLGARSRSEKHQDVVVLLKKIKVKNIDEKIKQVLSILSVKNLVEYEAREFKESDSRKIIIQVERLYVWVSQLLPIRED